MFYNKKNQVNTFTRGFFAKYFEYFEVATAYWIDTSSNISDVTCNIIFQNAMLEITVTSKLVLYMKHVFPRAK